MKKNEEQKSREKKGGKKKNAKIIGKWSEWNTDTSMGEGRKFFALIFLETRPGRN